MSGSACLRGAIRLAQEYVVPRDVELPLGRMFNVIVLVAIFVGQRRTIYGSTSRRRRNFNSRGHLRVAVERIINQSCAESVEHRDVASFWREVDNTGVLRRLKLVLRPIKKLQFFTYNLNSIHNNFEASCRYVDFDLFLRPMTPCGRYINLAGFILGYRTR